MKENDEIRMTRLWQPPARQANDEVMTKSESVAHASRVLRSASLLDLFGANGAYQPSLGQRPRDVEPSRAQALKARFIQRWYLGRTESRFQRWVLLCPRSWGAAPGCHETAPLALNSECQLIAPNGGTIRRQHARFVLRHLLIPSSLDIRLPRHSTAEAGHSSFSRTMCMPWKMVA
jgi:hypothetical protein